MVLKISKDLFVVNINYVKLCFVLWNVLYILKHSFVVKKYNWKNKYNHETHNKLAAIYSLYLLYIVMIWFERKVTVLPQLYPPKTHLEIVYNKESN